MPFKNLKNNDIQLYWKLYVWCLFKQGQAVHKTAIYRGAERQPDQQTNIKIEKREQQNKVRNHFQYRQTT